jgi:hypothetical protein
MAVWFPVDMRLYLQLESAVAVAVDKLQSAQQRDALLPMTKSKGDALSRLTSVLPYAQTPSDLVASCRLVAVAAGGWWHGWWWLVALLVVAGGFVGGGWWLCW